MQECNEPKCSHSRIHTRWSLQGGHYGLHKHLFFKGGEFRRVTCCWNCAKANGRFIFGRSASCIGRLSNRFLTRSNSVLRSTMFPEASSPGLRANLPSLSMGDRLMDRPVSCVLRTRLKGSPILIPLFPAIAAIAANLSRGSVCEPWVVCAHKQTSPSRYTNSQPTVWEFIEVGRRWIDMHLT